MPKLKNVTNAELKEALDTLDMPMQSLHDLNDRMEKNYSDEIESPIAGVRTLLAMARAASALASTLLVKHALQEQRAETEKLIRDRAAK